MTNKIKIVKYGGRFDPVYEEIGELEAMEIPIGRFSEKEELCIDVDDLMDWINRK